MGMMEAARMGTKLMLMRLRVVMKVVRMMKRSLLNITGGAIHLVYLEPPLHNPFLFVWLDE